MNQADAFTEHRPLLFSIAYRMLGSVMDAEDMVQETYLRWDQARPAELRSPKSYLSTVVTRLCIDQLRSARAQREQYIGPWLPEPLIADETPAMDERLIMDDSISMAFLVLLERLSPIERAVFLLRDVFDYEYAEIASVVEKTEANCRQMVRRARQHVAEGGRRFEASPEQLERVAERFLQATTSGSMQALIDILAEDVTLRSDGGGKVAAALNPIYGSANVARFFVRLLEKAPPGFSIRRMRVNGAPGVIAYIDGRPQSVVTADVADGKICAVHIVVNPDKLRHVPPLAS